MAVYEAFDDKIINRVGGSSGGHTIWNRIKTALTQRSKLWFKDATVSDVSADGASAVEVITSVSESDFDNLPTDGTADGIYEMNSSDVTPLMADNIGYGEGSVKDALDALNAVLFNNAGAHNAIYRGKNLGTSVTAEQWSVITAGTFDDLYIGDYWTINGTVYRIADFDYFLRSGNKECTTHHVVIVPDTALYNAQMNTTNVTTGGYTGSAMYTANLATAKTTIKAAFGASHILTHREFLCNAVTNGRPSGGAWVDSDIELMSESMAYGAPHFEPTSDGSTVPFIYSVACKQLNLFRFRPDLISNRVAYWLRNVVSAAIFAYVDADGACNCADASNAFGVRPTFAIY